MRRWSETARGQRQPSEALWLGLILAAAGGFMDAYTYIARGKVFANAQTGNLVLLGIRAFEGDVKAWCYLVPVCAFVLGILLAQTIKAHRSAFLPLHWRQAVLMAEALVLAAAAFAPESCNDLVNAGISFACAMQVDSFRTFEGNPYATTMCTGNLRSGTEHLWRYFSLREAKSLRAGLGYFAVILSFVLGAGIGARMTEHFMNITALVPAAILLLAAALMQVPARRTER